jgi:hypothetical protein
MSKTTKKKRLNTQSSILSEDNVEVDPANATTDELLDPSFINETDSKYTIRYRFVKTALLIFAWIVYSLNYEMIGPTFEDLKHFMNVNYSYISFAIVLRNVGFFTVTLLLGLVFDRISRFSESFMAISSFLMSICNFLVPVTRNYTLSMFYYLLQGFCQAVFELGGNFIILR